MKISSSEIIRGTPTWVWGIFVYLFIVGIKATKPTTIPLFLLLLFPLVLIGFRYKIFFSDLSIYFSVFLAGGIGLGFLIAQKQPIKILKAKKSIELPGNYHTLTLLLLFFIAKYIFGYLEATQKEIALQYGLLDVSFSGLFYGYFLGRCLSYIYRFFRSKKVP